MVSPVRIRVPPLRLPGYLQAKRRNGEEAPTLRRASGSSSVLQHLGEGVFEGRGGAILQYPLKPRHEVWDA
jgi:hypothetical protein